SRMLRKIFSLDPTLNNIYKFTEYQISEVLSIPYGKAVKVYSDLHDLTLQKQINQDLNNFQVITIVDENYPSMLKTINDPPFVLYAIGKLDLLQQSPALSVIGTRNPSSEAKSKIRYIVKPLVKNKWVIVSGMAKGIDSLAHWLSLAYQGKTIAVLGGGFHHIYPKQNIPLFNQITEKGLILSEYAPHIPPKPY